MSTTTVAGRAAFPAGLRVMLIDNDTKDRQAVEQQLLQLHYDVRSCTSVQQAISALSTPAIYAADVIMVDLDACTEQLKRCITGIPSVVISRSSDASSVMRGIAFGACEVLQKPLCNLKLKNVWQHTVRKLMAKTSSCKQTSQGSNRSLNSPRSTSDPACCSANSSQIDSGSLASSAANIKVDKELEQDVQSTRQHSSSLSSRRTGSGSLDNFTPRGAIAPASAAAPSTQRSKNSTAMGIPHSGPFLPLPQGLAWGFPHDLTKITTPLQMPAPPPLPFPLPAALPMMPPPVPGMLPPFPFPPFPFLPGMMPPPPTPTTTTTQPPPQPPKPAAPTTTTTTAPPKLLPPMIPTPAPSGTIPLLPTDTTTTLCPLPSPTSPPSFPPLPPLGPETDLDDLDGLLPAFPEVLCMAEELEELEEHPLAKACAADDGDCCWVTELQLSSSPLCESLLSGASCGTDGDHLLGLCLKKSSSFADLINETLSFCS